VQVYGHHGYNGFVQMEHHFVPIHHLPFNLALQYPIFLGMLLLSQGCDHVAKALGLNHKACDYCFCEGASLLPLFLFALVFIFSRCKFIYFSLVFMSSSCKCPLFHNGLMFSSYYHLFLCIGLFVLKLLPSSFSSLHIGLLIFKLLRSSFSQWSSCTEVASCLFFLLIFVFSNCTHPPFHNGLHVFKLQFVSSLHSRVRPILPITMVFMYLKFQFATSLCWSSCSQVGPILIFTMAFINSNCNLPLLYVGLHVLKLDPSSSSHWFYCFQIIVIFIFILVFLFSSYCPLPLPIGLCVSKLEPSSFSQSSSCWSCY
jgi:hypothetical protein